MVMRMNKQNFIIELQKQTNYTEEQCNIIENVLKKHKIIGRKNKEIIKEDLVQKLEITDEQADKLYNIYMELKMKEIFL